ncbi:6075_t:CDS:2, partial [Racocetra persica]
DNLVMQQPALTLYHVQVMERLHVDIAFGVDIIENNSFNNLVPFLKAELKKSFMPKVPRAASIAAAAAIAKHDGGSNPDNSSHERSNRKDASIKEEICEVNKLIIFQQRQSGAGYCLRHHICKYIMRAKGNLSESTLSKHIASDMEELQITKFPVEPEEREFIKYCQEQCLGIKTLSSGHVKLTANSALEILRRHGIYRVSCEVFMETDGSMIEG